MQVTAKMNLDYAIAIAEQALEKAKREAREYLIVHNGIDWYSKFEDCIARIMRREPPGFNFGSGGHPEWYAEATRLFSNWVTAEYEHCKLLAKKMEISDIPSFLDEDDGDF